MMKVGFAVATATAVALSEGAQAPSPTGRDRARSLGADAIGRNLTLTSATSTGISHHDAACVRPSFNTARDGTGNIAGGAVVASLIAAL